MTPIEYIEACLDRADQFSPLHIPYIDDVDFTKITGMHELFKNCRAYPMFQLDLNKVPAWVKDEIEALLASDSDDLHKTGNERDIRKCVHDHDQAKGTSWKELAPKLEMFMTERDTTPIMNAKEVLDAISPTMCLAKWNSLTINFLTGENHSCHHPGMHKIPDEVADNPHLLHNTPHKMEARQQMLDGKRPPECAYCWKHEDNGFLSDRHIKSKNYLPKVIPIIKSGVGPEYFTSYVELVFDNVCNFMCIYCTPRASSKWNARAREPFGGRAGMQPIIPVSKSEDNKFTDAFWKLWPDWYPKLHRLRVSGGEPLLSKHTWKLFDYIRENPRDMHFEINSNLGVPDNLIDKLIENINSVKNPMIVHSSAEATGDHQNYIRNGMDYDKWLKNVRRILTETNAQFSLMTTINMLSFATIDKLFNEMYKLKKEFGRTRIYFIPTNLMHPDNLALTQLPRMLKDVCKSSLEAVLANPKNEIKDHEKLGIERIIAFMYSAEADVSAYKYSMKYFDSYDETTGMSFGKTFPVLKHLMLTEMSAHA